MTKVTTAKIRGKTYIQQRDILGRVLTQFIATKGKIRIERREAIKRLNDKGSIREDVLIIPRTKVIEKVVISKKLKRPSRKQLFQVWATTTTKEGKKLYASSKQKPIGRSIEEMKQEALNNLAGQDNPQNYDDEQRIEKFANENQIQYGVQTFVAKA